MSNVESLGYEVFLKLPDQVREELVFWRDNIHGLNAFHFSQSLSVVAETRLLVVTDSSKSGSFGYQFQDKYKILLRRSFRKKEDRALP